MMDWYKVITVMSVHTLSAYWPHPQTLMLLGRNMVYGPIINSVN
jgi:hypothetical protein